MIVALQEERKTLKVMLAFFVVKSGPTRSQHINKVPCYKSVISISMSWHTISHVDVHQFTTLRDIKQHIDPSTHGSYQFILVRETSLSSHIVLVSSSVR